MAVGLQRCGVQTEPLANLVNGAHLRAPSDFDIRCNHGFLFLSKLAPRQ
jgi:hypothetical protein